MEKLLEFITELAIVAERDGCPNNLRVPCGSVSAQSYTERKPNFDSRNLEESRGSVL